MMYGFHFDFRNSICDFTFIPAIFKFGESIPFHNEKLDTLDQVKNLNYLYIMAWLSQLFVEKVVLYFF